MGSSTVEMPWEHWISKTPLLKTRNSASTFSKQWENTSIAYTLLFESLVVSQHKHTITNL